MKLNPALRMCGDFCSATAEEAGGLGSAAGANDVTPSRETANKAVRAFSMGVHLFLWDDCG
ncbi:MAG TPA: hypothetical protein VG326_12060 [Tepidisphaeraceae bacterium]|nr:hypothetical protein [Tepidisphaeraceae bacterium]